MLQNNLSRGQYGDTITPIKAIYVGKEISICSFDGYMPLREGNEILKNNQMSVREWQKEYVTWDTAYGWMRCNSPK